MLTELQVMQSQHLSSQMQNVFKNQVDEVLRLEKLVNDFLLMSQLKAGALYVSKTAVDFSECCLDTIEKLRRKVKEKQQTCKIEFQPADADFIVSADKNQLQIILYNLLENAVKYGSESKVINIIITKIKTQSLYR